MLSAVKVAGAVGATVLAGAILKRRGRKPSAYLRRRGRSTVEPRDARRRDGPRPDLEPRRAVLSATYDWPSGGATTFRYSLLTTSSTARQDAGQQQVSAAMAETHSAVSRGDHRRL